MEESDWNKLIDRIGQGLCTPFLGAGVNHGVLPLGADIANSWAKAESYPLPDTSDLARVGQFLAVKYDGMDPKDRIKKEFRGIATPDFDVADQPLDVLAELPLPVYITTNYDDFMVKALEHRRKEPRKEFCRWNSLLRKPGIPRGPRLQPTPANPIVFHLHGHLDVVESLVLTEDDYIDFLVSVSKDQNLLPPRIQEALTGSSLLFIGYRLADINFRVVYRGLVQAMEGSLRRMSVSVQFPRPEQPAQEEYLNRYFDKMDVKVFWGSAQEFAAELRARWRRANGG